MHIFTREAFNSLRANMTSNNEKYHLPESWTKDYFRGKPCRIETDLAPGKAELIISDNPKDDLENIKIFYERYKNLTFEEASDARLWTWMAHETYYSYVKVRWFKNKEEIKPSSVRERFFFSASGKGKLRNALARLWWYGKASYDESYSNHYALTEILLKDQDIAQSIFERNFSRNLNLTKNILKAFYEIKEESGKLPSRYEVREFSKKLRRLGAFAVTDLLTRDQIKEMVLAVMNK